MLPLRIIDNNHFIQQVGEYCLAHIQQAIAERNQCYWVLAGGNTPKKIYTYIAQEKKSQHIDWQKVHILFGDERAVPLDHAESNFKMAKDALLQYLTIPATQIYPIYAEDTLRAEGIKQYQQLLMDMPVMDLVLLGMGEDGHTASLFPQTTILQTTQTYIDKVWVDKLKTWRVSMTYTAINAARKRAVLVSGKSKCHILSKVVATWESKQYPIQSVQIENTDWLIDKDASECVVQSLDINRFFY